VKLKQIFNSLSFYSLYIADLKELTYLYDFRYRFQNIIHKEISNKMQQCISILLFPIYMEPNMQF